MDHRHRGGSDPLHTSAAAAPLPPARPQVFTEAEPLDDDTRPLGAPGTYPKLNWLKAGILSADKVRCASGRSGGGAGGASERHGARAHGRTDPRSPGTYPLPQRQRRCPGASVGSAAGTLRPVPARTHVKPLFRQCT